MEWYVWYDSYNARKITALNIFRHKRFREDVEKSLNECKDKETFEKELDSHLMHYFYCKAAYEILIYPWCGNSSMVNKKVDIYTQVKLNWKPFLDYVWNNKAHNSNS